MATLFEKLRLHRLLSACAASILSAFTAGCSEGAETASREVRLPAVEGQFYPAHGEKLRAAVEGFLEDALAAPPERPLGLVAPHAGYVFSGQIAADAFARARGHDYDLVAILGTPHTVPRFEGVALLPRGAFRTPLGDAEIDEDAARELLRSGAGCLEYREAHAREHSVEVQVPFVQVLFPRAKILPAIVGSASPDVGRRFAEAFAKIARDRKALVVASSDLSHYPRYEDARRADRAVLEALASLDPARFRAAIDEEERRGVPGLSTCACGEAPILTLLATVKALGATRAEVASYANSGDCLVAGDPDRVVGYGAVAFYAGAPAKAEAKGEPERASAEPALDAASKKALLAFARKTIRRFLETGMAPLPRPEEGPFALRRGAFVTLKKKGELRGCIGHMAADTTLVRVVGQMALQAAFADRRFTPVRAEELQEIELEISVLTPARPVSGPGEIVVGRDGVVLAKAGRSAVFLPQVATEQGWGLEEMLEHLSRKAGLPPGSWKEGAQFSTFQAEVFKESEF